MTLVHLVLSLILVGHARDLDQVFSKTKARLGDKTIEIYLADTEARRARGLMFVEKLRADAGMLFVFDPPQRLGFWMKNTLIPLAIAFLDEACVVREVVEMAVEPTQFGTDLRTYRSRRDAKFALEMNSGWFAGGHAVGAKLKLLSPAGVSRLAHCK